MTGLYSTILYSANLRSVCGRQRCCKHWQHAVCTSKILCYCPATDAPSERSYLLVRLTGNDWQTKCEFSQMLYLLERKDHPESGGCIRWQQRVQHTQNSLLLLLAVAALHDLLGQLYKAIITWLIWNAYRSQQLQLFLRLVAGWSVQANHAGLQKTSAGNYCSWTPYLQAAETSFWRSIQ